MSGPSSLSRGRSSSPSPYGFRKPYPSSSSSSSSSASNGRIVPRSSPASVSTNQAGIGTGGAGRSVTPSRGRTGGKVAPVIGLATDEELLAEDALRSAGDSISVTVRFRPLSEREYQRGDEIAWYADGDRIVRNEYNSACSYAFDKVFGPSTISQSVYNVAARPVIKASMDGINGTVFAYGVTSSGKTHTMHGDKKSPGIIPLAINDVFSMIQETPGREFLLRVSYIEIYNEVINDLLDPMGQNLRIREDSQGTYVEGIKEEVVLSPGHALSFIATGEEHRHVGSNNFNLLSSRSHTIFTMMIESSALGDEYDGVTFSQLNLIDLAGSESSKTETTGLRKKEGAYINKSLLTLGTVIGKLSEGKSSHVPYRDSKLTRLLQSSLSGNGHVSLICTVTPASSNYEETHNTLKFANRAKRVEIKASRNQIIDEKSLIKKYQNEITTLKEELDQLKEGMIVGVNQEEVLILRQQLEEGQVKMRSRLEEEEEAKAALMSRIQRLTKLILVSTKNTIPGCLSHVSSAYQQRQSSEDADKSSGMCVSSPMLPESGVQNPSSSTISLGQHFEIKQRRPSSELNDELTSISGSVTESAHAVEDAGMATFDQMDLFSEQVKMLAGEIALGMSTLKRLKEHSTNDPDNSQIQNMERDIQEKQRQMSALEQQITMNNASSNANANMVQMQQSLTKLMSQCNEKGFELELRTADNRILREQLQERCCENSELHEKISNLEQQLNSVMGEKLSCKPCTSEEIDFLKTKILSQDVEIGNLNLERLKLLEENSDLQIQKQKLAEETSYAKELASAAAVELKNLAEEVTKLSLQNAMQAKELLSARELAYSRSASMQAAKGVMRKYDESKVESTRGRRRSNSRGIEVTGRVNDEVSCRTVDLNDLKMELQTRKQREASLEVTLAEKELTEKEYKFKYDESRKREMALENELAGMWVLVAKLKKGVLGVSDLNVDDKFSNGIEIITDFKKNINESIDITNDNKQLEDGALKPNGDHYNQKANLEPLLVRLKAQIHEMKDNKLKDEGNIDANSHTCKVCFETSSAVVLIPCRHFCLCKPCSLACSECPVCRTEITDRIITFTS